MKAARWLAGLTMGGLLAALAMLWWMSPGELDREALGLPPSGLCERRLVTINGVPQGMFIQSADSTKPVLLIVHGGPGMPIIFLDQQHPTGLAQDFTVCWWEQRGAGISFTGKENYPRITVDQLVDDTIAVARYLAARFGKERIVLLGHSWGSFIGIQAAARAPELFAAYIGVGQLADQRRSELESYDFMVREYTRQGDTRRLRQLEPYRDLGANPQRLLDYADALVRDQAMHELGIGTLRGMHSLWGLLGEVAGFRGYTLKEKLDLFRAKSRLREETILRREQLAANLFRRVPRLELPALFVSGAFDRTVSAAISREYCDSLLAPRKSFHLFPRSAHSPLFEEPGRFRALLRRELPALR